MITKTVYKDRTEWLSVRESKPTLGSSDVGIILGLCQYVTPYQYWCNVKKKEVEQDEEREAAMLRGQYKEEAVARQFEERTGEKVINTSGAYITYKNDKFPDYVQVSPDRELFAKKRRKRPILECKDTRRYIAEMEKETPPDWWAQIQFQMGVMERDLAYICAETGSKDLVYCPYEFNAEAFEKIMTRCCEWFEKYIIGDEVPPVETAADAAIAWPVSMPKVKRVDSSLFSIAEQLSEKKQQLRHLQDEIKAMEDKVRVSFEDCDTLEFNGNPIATYKSIETDRIDPKLLREKYPEIAAEVTKKSITRKLNLKL